MDIRTRLSVKHDNGGAFTTHSQAAHDFKRDTFDAVMTTDDFLYVGFRKTINALYLQISAVNTIATTMTVEYYNGTTWVDLEAIDDTNGFTRSAFINWLRPDDAEAITIDGEETCWIRLSVSEDTSTITFQAINIIFSDDNDICQEVPALVDACFFTSGQKNHILKHVASNNKIMSRLRSIG